MNRLKFPDIQNFFKGKRVAIIGSAPCVLENNGGHIDSYDEVIRVNNYKIKPFQNHVGSRCDIHYAFYGSSIRKRMEQLKTDGVKFCMCKCPDDLCFDHHKMVDWDQHNRGGNYKWIYENRKDWWFTDIYVPDRKAFMDYMGLLKGHVPTTGFSCILDLLQCECKELYITGFDGFKSKVHNINESWRDKKERFDPVCHEPDKEMELIKHYNDTMENVKVDMHLQRRFNAD